MKKQNGSKGEVKMGTMMYSKQKPMRKKFDSGKTVEGSEALVVFCYAKKVLVSPTKSGIFFAKPIKQHLNLKL